MVSKRTELLTAVILIGILLRLWGIDFGLPFLYHQDEPIVVNHALAYGSGDLNPHFFIIPPLTSYILFFFYGIKFTILILFGLINGTEAFAISFFRDPSSFYLLGRLAIGFLPSIISIYLTYRLARKFFSFEAALYSALMMAVAFLNVINAHYIYTDNLLVMLILCAYLAIISMAKTPSIRNYILCAISIGIGIAVKYNAAILVVPFFLAHIFANNIRNPKSIIFSKALIISIGVMSLAFIVCNPYALLDFRFFLLSIRERINGNYIGFFHHIRYSLFQGIGIFTTVLGTAGLFIFLSRRSKESVLILSFPIIFFIHLIFMSQLHSRYVLVLVPFISIGAGFLLFDYIIKQSNSPRVLIFTMTLLVLVPTLGKSLKADMLFVNKDTRTEAFEWIDKNLPMSSKIAMDNTSFIPQLRQTKSQLYQKQAILKNQPELKDLKSRKLDLQIKAFKADKTFEVYYLGAGDENKGQFLNLWPFIGNSREELSKHAIEYVVFNNMTKTEGMQELRKDLQRFGRPIAAFNPYIGAGFRRPYDDIDVTCMPIDDRELFSRRKSGPYIEIYRVE
ncbi:ArnT family glycosyltransferase [Candidatus Omnitrophota bacterium]